MSGEDSVRKARATPGPWGHGGPGWLVLAMPRRLWQLWVETPVVREVAAQMGQRWLLLGR